MDRRKFLETMGLTPLAVYARSRNAETYQIPQESVKKADKSGSLDPRVEVSLDHIGFNLDQIRKRVKVPVMAVVKANAYGHGLVEVSRYLEKRGVEGLMVGKLQEALELRSQGVNGLILNFGPFGKDDSEAIVRGDLCQNVYTEDVHYLEEAARRFGQKAGVDIHVDTGMNRVGIPYDRALPLIEKISSLPHLKIHGVSTTLTEDPDFDKEQLKRFLDVCGRAEKKGISLGKKHAASSDGLFPGPEFYLDMVRPGITLYGYYPNSETQKEDSLGLRPALQLFAYVTFIKDLAPGESLSYHRAFKAQKKMRVATLGIGYSDGFPAQVPDKGLVSIGSKKYKIMAALTANHLMIDLDNDASVKLGDEVSLISRQKDSDLTADMVAERAGISDYKLLICLNPLMPRNYLVSREQ
jgi:alanine racemase